MEGRSALVSLAPIGLALLALITRETTRPERFLVPVEGRALEIAPPLLPGAAVPSAASWHVEPQRSSARMALPDGSVLDLCVRGSLRAGSDGALVDVDLQLAPFVSCVVHVSGASTPFASSAISIVGTARAELRLEADGASDTWSPQLEWTRRLDGSAACLIAGELASGELGLPRAVWSRILLSRRPAWLALELTLVEDD